MTGREAVAPIDGPLEAVRICVVGAGAIGGMMAARLAAAGHAVSVVARGEHLDAIRRDGLRLVEVDGTETVASNLHASDDFGALGPHDTVILALKAHQIAAVAHELGRLCDHETIVVPVQNGIGWWYFERHGGPHDGRRLEALDPDGTIAGAIGSERVVACVAYPAAEKTAPGVITHVEGDRFPVGELDGTKSDRAKTLAEALTSAGFKSRVLTDIRSHLWVKAWGNLAFNPISALTGATLGEICRTPATRELAARMMTEAVELPRPWGCAFGSVSSSASRGQRLWGSTRRRCSRTPRPAARWSSTPWSASSSSSVSSPACPPRPSAPSTAWPP